MAATATAAGGAADAARGHLQFVPIEEDAAPEGLDGSRVPFDGATELFKDGYTPLRDVGEEGAGTAAEAPEAHRSIILVTTAMFMGYAVLVCSVFVRRDFPRDGAWSPPGAECLHVSPRRACVAPPRRDLGELPAQSKEGVQHSRQ
jgi:hypothetical protein